MFIFRTETLLNVLNT